MIVNDVEGQMDSDFSIKEKTFDKILNFAHYAKDKFQSEIGGMCVVLKDENGDYELVDPVILKQTISGGNCDLDKDELAVYYTKADQKYNKYDYSFCWWHSHHTLGAFWSGTDTSTMEEAAGSKVSYSLVVSWNKDPYGHLFRISYWHPIALYKDIQLEITDRKNKRIPKSIIKEVEDKCSKYMPVSRHVGSPLNNHGYSYYRRGYQHSLFESPIKKVQEDDPAETYGIILDLVDKVMNKMVNGTIVYHDYVAEIKEINDKLGEDHPISVKTEHEICIDNILVKTASDYVEYDLTKENSKLDDMMAINTIEGDWQ